MRREEGECDTMYMVQEIPDKDGNVVLVPPEWLCANKAEIIDRKRKRELVELDDAKQELDDINTELMRLLYRREQAIDMLSFKARACVGSFLGDEHALKAIYDSWTIAGWSSSLVKEAVKQVREVLLDDTKPECQAYLCTEIRCDQFYSEISDQRLEFIFMRDNDPRTAFKLTVPFKNTIGYNWKYAYLNGSYNLLKLTGGQSHGSLLMASSTRLLKLREIALDFILNKKVVKQPYDTHLRDMRDALSDRLLGLENDRLAYVSGQHVFS